MKKISLICIIFFISLVIFFAIFIYYPNTNDDNNNQKPNIILIVIDTLRPDHLSCYGHNRKTSPNIDSIAQKGVTFLNHFSTSSITMTSTASIFTGLLPYKHMAAFPHPIKPRALTISELLKTIGYTTVGFIGNVQVSKEFGFGRGFDTYYEEEVTDKVNNVKDAKIVLTIPYLDRNIADKSMSWLRENQDKNFFMYIHFLGGHHPYKSYQPFKDYFIDGDKYENQIDFFNLLDEKYTDSLFSKFPDLLEIFNAIYDNKIRQIDSYIGEIYNTLKEVELLNNTLLIITSDHGEEFYEHGSFYHGATLFEEVIKVPLVISYPKLLKMNYYEPIMSQSTDILPSILELLNIKCPQDIDGSSFLSIIKKSKLSFINKLFSKDRDKIFCELFCPTQDPKYALFAVRSKDYKIIKKLSFKPRTKQESLAFHLRADPFEKMNLSDANGMETILEKAIDKANSHIKTMLNENSYEEKLDKNVIEQLRSLGYIQ